MTDLIITARSKGDSEEYTLPASHGLTVQCRLQFGDGSPASPWVQEVQIAAGCAFAGVIRIALPVDNQARFFLPGFMYGTNRGESPLVVDSKCPRLRAEENFPASPWWMVRSDRLSHPCAFVFGSGRLTRFAASPYYVRTVDGRVPWQPGIHGDFDQYCGFGCSLTPGELVYTLGYENARGSSSTRISIFPARRWTAIASPSHRANASPSACTVSTSQRRMSVPFMTR